MTLSKKDKAKRRAERFAQNRADWEDERSYVPRTPEETKAMLEFLRIEKLIPRECLFWDYEEKEPIRELIRSGKRVWFDNGEMQVADQD